MKKKVAIILFILILAFILINFVGFYFFREGIFDVFFTGKALSTSIVNITAFGDTNKIFILSPQNTTYSFDIGEPYNISLNVTSNFTVDYWNYSLYDHRHNLWVYQDVPFTPNTSFIAVRFENELFVSANDTVKKKRYTKSVNFTVSVPNSAPSILGVDNPILVCEGKSLDYFFNATDVDEDFLTGSISKIDPFFLSNLGKVNYTTTQFRIFSGVLLKGDIGNHSQTITVDDGYSASCCVDSVSTNITVIEINNPPSLENLGAQTVWTRGVNSTFYHQWDASDLEDGTSAGGSLHFNLTFSANENLFNIDPNYGIVNYTPAEDEVGVYSIEVCVRDNPLSNPHPNISICAPANYTSNSACDSFTLTVTNQNRAPEIINYTPNASSLEIKGESYQVFYAEVFDADGTIPDIDWYVDGILAEHNENVSNDTFAYNPPCGTNGTKIISVYAKDGLLNDSVSWSVDVESEACPSGGVGGGGGGGSEYYCREDWACSTWGVCKNALNLRNSKVLGFEEYIQIRDLCRQKGYSDDNCGVQERLCRDLNKCVNRVPRVSMPKLSRVCFFTLNPQCNDGIQNCHDGSCEVKVDCGGPCAPCPTCSDGKQNQGEEGIDCGGPCKNRCIGEVPLKKDSTLFYWLIFVFSFLVLFSLWKLFKLVFSRKQKTTLGRIYSQIRGS